ncbi:MAG TPA: TIR domain-containing protein [Algoriphagus sp.]|nr:TIR domain-containing protein [Algoriphagus sp.]
MNHFFVSYHHRSSAAFLQEMRARLNDPGIKDYGFRQIDLGENSKYSISKSIQSRIWATSVTVVLVGDQTGDSDWVDWEIWYSLRKLKAIGPARRAFKPKGLLAIFLPVSQHNIPKRLKENLDSGYALSLEWKDLEKEFYKKMILAFQNRTQKHLIRNDLPPNINPQGLFGKIENWLGIRF